MKWPSLQPWTPKSDWLPISSTGIILESNIRSWGEALEKLLMGSTNSLWRIWIPMLRCTRLKTYQRNVRLVKVRYTFIYNWIFVGLFGILNSTFASWFSATSSSSTLLLTSSAFPLLFPLFMKSNWFLCPALCSLDRFSSRPAISLSFLERGYSKKVTFLSLAASAQKRITDT